ncbi:hypothetical protein KKC97_06730, partial [bacterium]|nr:hypothetical protein [bacterium]
LHDSNDPIIVPSPALGLSVTSVDEILVCCFNSDELVKLDADGTLLTAYNVGDGPLAVGIQTP